MIIKARVKKKNHVMGITFSLTDKVTSYVEASDPDCYLALRSLISASITFINGHDKHDGTINRVENPVDAYDFDFGSTIAFISDDGKRHIAMRFHEDYVSIRTENSKLIKVDNEGMIKDGDTKIHMSVMLMMGHRDLFSQIKEITIFDKFNNMNIVPIKFRKDIPVVKLATWITEHGDSESEHTFAYDIVHGDSFESSMTIGCLQMLSGPVIIFDAYRNDDEKEPKEQVIECIDQIRDATYDTIYNTISDMENPDLDIEHYKPDYPVANIVFVGNPIDSTNMYFDYRRVKDGLLNTIGDVKDINELDDRIKNQQFFNPNNPDFSILAFKIENGKVVIENEESIKRFVDISKLMAGLGPDDRLPPLKVNNSVGYSVINGSDLREHSSDYADSYRDQIVQKLHDLGLDLVFVDPDDEDEDNDNI